MDHLGLGFTIMVAIGLIGWGGLIAFFWPDLWRPSRRREVEAEQFETSGSITDLSDYIAEREAQDARARFRHATRYGRSA